MSGGQNSMRLRDELAAAVRTVSGLRVHTAGADVAPPAVSIGAPSYTWSALGDVDEVTVPVVVFVAADDRALPRLLVLVEEVADAIHEHVTDGVVVRAVPSFFTAGGTELPAYALTVDCAVG